MENLLSNPKNIFSGLAILLTLVGFAPYIFTVLKGTTKPHVFSWLIWGTTTAIVFFAQVDADGGVGAWPIGVSGAITLFIVLLAFLKRADIQVTRVDWIFFTAALSAIPFWYFTADPLWAVILLTVVDLLGFGPTIRKAYAFPQQENTVFFGLFIIRNALVIAALEQHSVTTVLFPLSVSIACILLVLMIYWRRWQLRS